MVFEVKYCQHSNNKSNNNNKNPHLNINNSYNLERHQRQQFQLQPLQLRQRANRSNKNVDNINKDAKSRIRVRARKQQTHNVATKSGATSASISNSHACLKAPSSAASSSSSAQSPSYPSSPPTPRYSGRKSIVKWKIIISSILSLLCCTSHVLAIRKGRLMSPSSFTALSGDLHVQIQFSGDELGAGGVSPATTTTIPNTNANNLTTLYAANNANSLNVNKMKAKDVKWRQQPKTSRKPGTSTDTSSISSTSSSINNDSNSSTPPPIVESFVMSTLVISKYVDDDENYDVDATAMPGSTDTQSNAAAMPTTTTSLPSTPPVSREQLLQRKRKEIIQNIPLFPDPRHNVTQIAVPCQTFLRGGIYEMAVITNLRSTATANSDEEPAPTLTTTTLMPVTDERLRQTLDVRWPSAEMLVSPVRLRTYPSSPVEVTLRFPEVNCERAWRSEHLPEFWLELVYCGKERTCTQLPPQNISKSSILYAEQVRGFPKQKVVRLGCELFGLAGNYAVQLRPMVAAPNVPITRRFLSVDWSEKYVFNVYARSIFPCDPHTGIGVLYEYPGCILEQGDRVRVYAKLRADVASLKPPTSLHYVAEQRVVKSQYSLYFSCDLFTEKYVEYCFVYVSQAISGAVADVRVDCVPTLPVSDSDTGGWGPWSEWTPCSTNCLGGTRNRYRFCDSPPPRYGAKFCEGASVESEKCGKSIGDTWDCIYETSGSNFLKNNRTDVNQEIGPGCRCGCIVHLGASKPKRIIAGATQSCPGRSFWLIQVDGDEHISLSLNFLRLPCATQYIKVRDGPSLSSTLLIELNGGGGDGGGGVALNYNLPIQLESSGAQLLIEFLAGDEGNTVSSTPATTTAQPAAGNLLNAAVCTGGFLANVEQIAPNATAAPATGLFAAGTRLLVKSRAVVQKPSSKFRAGFTLVHLSAVIFASIIILISALLGAQYMVRYRKYHLAIARRRDEGSRLHTPHESMTSLQSPPSRAMSTTTLISEVIYMVKMRPKHQLRHSILRESVDAEQLVGRETELNECGVPEVKTMPKCDEEFGSTGSILTLRNELDCSPVEDDSVASPSTAEQRLTVSHSAANDEDEDGVSTRSGTLTRKDSAKDSESIISSGMSSLCNSPPMASKRLSKYSDRYDAVTLKIRNSRLTDESSMQDCDSLRSASMKDYERFCRLGGARSHSASLTNGYYSPAASVVSTATIRTTNAKECKDAKNRKKLLARPGSEFSLGQQEELELDYYDYNVINAGAAPGSYLGMDPAYLIWIPPFDAIVDMREDLREDSDKTPEPPGETEPLYEEIKEIKMPKFGHYLSPHSNSESQSNTPTTATTSTTANTSPMSEDLSPLNSHSKASTPSTDKLSFFGRRSMTSSKQPPVKPLTPYMSRKKRRQFKQQSKSTQEMSKRGGSKELIPMQELQGTRSARNISSATKPATQQQQQQQPTHLIMTTSTSSDAMTGSYVEKETSVVKSPSDLQNFLAIDDIQFADDDNDESEVEVLKQVTSKADSKMMKYKDDEDEDEEELSESEVSIGVPTKGTKHEPQHHAFEKKRLLETRIQPNNSNEVQV